MNSRDGYWFKSSLFKADASEELETNPRRFGREPAVWLKEKLICSGRTLELFAEDWGWCIQCQDKPFRIYLACSNMQDYDTAKSGDPPPQVDDLLWHVFPFAEVPFFSRIFRHVDTNDSLIELEAELYKILSDEPQIEIVALP